MPYIPNEDRARAEFEPMTTGELNYAVTKVIDGWFRRRPEGLRYDTINAAIGVLECAKQELYRRLAAPYEDEKCAENGDVFRAREYR